MQYYTNEFHDLSQINILDDKLFSSLCFSDFVSRNTHKVTANKLQHSLIKYIILIRY